MELTRLKNQIYNLEREIKRDYADLGKMVYEQYLETGIVDEDKPHTIPQIPESTGRPDEKAR